MNPVISLLNNHDVEIRQKTQPGSIPRSDIANLLDALARMIEKDVDYALGIPFDSMVSSMTGKQLTANDKYFVSQVGSVPGGGCILTLKGDGSHSPDLTNFLVVSGSYSNTSGVVNQLIFYYDGANYCVSIIQLPAGAVLNTTAGSSGPDTTPPVVSSIAVFNSNPSQVVITYSEGLKTTAIPAASDFVVTAGGSPATINSVAVSANTVLLNLASAIITGSSNFIQYTPGTNKIQDLAGNLAAAIPVNTVITNNVGSTGDTTPPAVGTLTTSDATHILITFGETVTATLAGWSFTKNGATLTPSAISGSGTSSLTFTVPTMASGDALLCSYNSTTGDCKDAANNPLASFTNFTVTNTLSAGSSATNLSLAANAGYTNTTNVLTVTGGGTAWNNTGVDDHYIPAGTIGGVWQKYTATDAKDAMLGLSTINLGRKYANMPVAFMFSAGSLYKIDNGVLSSAIMTVSVGMSIQLYVDAAGNCKLRQSTDEAAWTDVSSGAFTTTIAGDRYIVSDINGDGKMYTPKATGAIAIPTVTGATGIDIAFASSTGLTNTSQVFTPSSNDTAYGHEGLDAKSLAASTSGRIWAKFTGGINSFLGFNATNALTGNASMKAAFYVIDAQYSAYKIDGGGSPVALNAQLGLNYYYGMYRDGSTGAMKLIRSADALNWMDTTVVLTTTYTGQLWPGADLHGESAAKIDHPQGNGIA